MPAGGPSQTDRRAPASGLAWTVHSRPRDPGTRPPSLLASDAGPAAGAPPVSCATDSPGLKGFAGKLPISPVRPVAGMTSSEWPDVRSTRVCRRSIRSGIEHPDVSMDRVRVGEFPAARTSFPFLPVPLSGVYLPARAWACDVRPAGEEVVPP
jgi:hypothetical protein